MGSELYLTRTRTPDPDSDHELMLSRRTCFCIVLDDLRGKGSGDQHTVNYWVYPDVTQRTPCRIQQGAFCLILRLLRMRRILVFLLVLSTLLIPTAPAAHADDPVQRAIAWLHTQQLADGSFGSASVTR